MSPAKRQFRYAVRGRRDQATEPGIAIDLQQTAESRQMHGRMVPLTNQPLP
jgi:hypothetical protein